MNRFIEGFSSKDLKVRGFKALLKSLIVLGIYFLVFFYLGEMFALVPGFLGTFQALVVLIVVFVVLGEFAAKTIVQPVINGVRGSLVLVYMVLSSDSGVVSLSLDNSVALMMDLSLFFAVGVILSLMSVVVSVLEFLFFLNRRAEKQANLLQADFKY